MSEESTPATEPALRLDAVTGAARAACAACRRPRGFRISVDLTRYYGDCRSRAYVWAAGARRVRWLEARLRRRFALRGPLCLLADGHLLLRDEPLALLRQDSAPAVRVIPLREELLPTGDCDDVSLTDRSVAAESAVSPIPLSRTGMTSLPTVTSVMSLVKTSRSPVPADPVSPVSMPSVKSSPMSTVPTSPVSASIKTSPVAPGPARTVSIPAATVKTCAVPTMTSAVRELHFPSPSRAPAPAAPPAGDLQLLKRRALELLERRVPSPSPAPAPAPARARRRRVRRRPRRAPDPPLAPPASSPAPPASPPAPPASPPAVVRGGEACPPRLVRALALPATT